MKKLFKGILEFQSEDFGAHKELFDQLKYGQKPHTLFIGCSDSRIVPSLLTKTQPGELFQIRNVANIIPPFQFSEQFVATSATLEYAVQVLEVETIVVCGHSNCGGCGALYLPGEELKEMPSLIKWLNLIQDVPQRVTDSVGPVGEENRAKNTEMMNVMAQMENLLSYPFVREKVKAGYLKILGWYYIIESGEVYNFNDETGYFENIQ
ncbi:MAG: carbonic anhydrase [bacterium]|nr:carbonic anhydrase [bacterium]